MNPNEQILRSLTWQGNSQKMYRAILNQIPVFLRGSIQHKIVQFLKAKNTSIVTEPLVFEAVQAIAPPDLAAQILRQLATMKSAPSS